MSDQAEHPAGESPEGAPSSEWSPAAGDEPAPFAAPSEPGMPAIPVGEAFPAGELNSGDAATATSADRPEIAVGAAFAGGFVMAMILRQLAK